MGIKYYTYLIGLGIALIPTVLFSQTTEKVGNREFIVHQVKAKETIYGISKQYGVHQDTIFAYNPTATQSIRIDQVLKFPHPKQKQTTENKPENNTKPNAKPIEYLVKAGDSMYALSKKFNVSVDDLIKWNPSLKSGLKADQTILIYSSTSPVVSSGREEVKAPQQKTEKKLPNVSLSSDCKDYQTAQKNFNVALLLPFQSGNNTNTKIAIEFFEGVKVAFDSLRKEGKNFELFVYDSKGPNDSAFLQKLLKKPELKTMDLIIGPLYNSSIPLVAEFASEHKIPMISPFAKSAETLENNPYLIKISPDDQTVANKSIQYFHAFYPQSNYILVDPGTRKDSLMHQYYYQALKKMKEKKNDTSHYHFTSWKSGGAIGKIKSSKEITVKDYMTKVNSATKKSDMIMVGLEDWLEFNNIEVDYYENLNVHIPTVNFAGFTDSNNVDFIKHYQLNTESDPSFYSFKGFYAAYTVAKALVKYGDKTCECLHEQNNNELPVSYRFTKENPANGWKNESILMMSFMNYRYSLVNY
jgi:LysM repeat protein/ABC-type branched-subunit amino acid transport system substrate-binding protein